MKYTAIGTPATGRRHGITFNTPTATPRNPSRPLGKLATARATAIPLQPAPNPQVATQQALAIIAAAWASLDSATQALWNAIAGPGGSGYAVYVAQNTLMIQWGFNLWDSPPPFTPVPGITFCNPYAEPDGISTTLCTIADADPGPGLETWIHLYVDWENIIPPTPGYTNYTAKATPVYVGSFAGVTADTVAFFDFTAIQNAFIGQWVPNGCDDTASETSCGGAYFAAQLYTTDQYGRQNLGYTPVLQPVYPFFWGPGAVAPGVCPLPTSPPYPWPTAADYYG